MGHVSLQHILSTLIHAKSNKNTSFDIPISPITVKKKRQTKKKRPKVDQDESAISYIDAMFKMYAEEAENAAKPKTVRNTVNKSHASNNSSGVNLSANQSLDALTAK